MSAAFDDYIASAPGFAQPVLRKIRALFHKACPEIEEVFKWRNPSFEYRGLVGGMAAFKAHVSFGFWKQKLVKGADRLPGRITSVKDLPPDKVLLAMIREAVRLNEEGIKLTKEKRAKPALAVPADLAAALKKNRQARATFDGFPPGQRREYIEWIVEAKQQATRDRRLATTIEWLAEGKRKNWKYEKC